MGVADFWANAGETLRRGTGDSEDIAIVKMQVLKAAGFNPKDLYISIGRHNVARRPYRAAWRGPPSGFFVLDDPLQGMMPTPSQHAPLHADHDAWPGHELDPRPRVGWQPRRASASAQRPRPNSLASALCGAA